MLIPEVPNQSSPQLTPSNPFEQDGAAKYLLAAFLVIFGVTLQLFLRPMSDEALFLLAYPCVYLIAWMAGLSAALFAVALWSVAIIVILYPSANGYEWASLAIFVILSTLTSWVVAKNIEWRKKNAAALRASEERYRKLVASSPDGIIVHRDGRAIFANPVALLLFEARDLQELRRCDLWTQILPERDKKTISARIEQLRSGMTIETRESRLRTLQGTEIPVETSSCSLEYDGAPAVQSIFRNISERKRAEEERAALLAHAQEARLEAEQAVEVRDDFLSIASHELKTPLTAIQLQVQIQSKLLERLELAPSTRERLGHSSDILFKELRRLTRLINDLLDVSRMGSGRLLICPEKVDVSQFVTEALQSQLSQILGAGMTLEANVEPGLLIPVDRMRLDQVLSNLISNAIKYAPGKPLKLSLESRGAGVRLRVQDHGPGVPVAFRERIFGRYERVNNGKSAPSGLGLGLFIARQIARAHGGDLRLEPSETGACFVMDLPKQIPGAVLSGLGVSA